MKPIPHQNGSARGKPVKVKEGAVVNACIKWLFANNCYVWRNNSGAYKTPSGHYIRYGEPGSADIIGVNPHGRFIAIECKSGKNTQQDSQKAWQERVEGCNGLYVVAYSVDDLEAIKADVLGAI